MLTVIWSTTLKRVIELQSWFIIPLYCQLLTQSHFPSELLAFTGAVSTRWINPSDELNQMIIQSSEMTRSGKLIYVAKIKQNQ